MAKWEYRLIRMDKPNELAEARNDQIEARLCALGSEGWEAVGITPANAYSFAILFKRPVTVAEERLPSLDMCEREFGAPANGPWAGV
jgi:hypothetical protein